MALKVYGGYVFSGPKQERAIVAADNQQQAAKIAGVSLYYLQGWWAVTGNRKEIRLASPYTLIFPGGRR
mgnify:CR=1 FL=1